MRAQICRIDPVHPDQKLLEQAGAINKRGGLVAFPTETVYGLGGNALDETSSQKIYAAKGRPSDNPLIVHIADLDHLGPIVGEIPDQARRLAARYWPGPLTMIFQKNARVPLSTTGGLDTVAVRMPDHPLALAFIRESGGYIAAPSANRSGRPSPTTAQHVAEDLGETIDLILDGGPVGIGIESTIVDFTGEVPTILRPGYISQEMLEEVLGSVEMDRALIHPDSGIRPKAPGMKYRHYAPRADLTIVAGDQEAVIEQITALAQEQIDLGHRVGIIATEESRMRYPLGLVRSIGSRCSEETIAHNLYDILRGFDETDVDLIYSEAFDTPQMGEAIMNRLRKAAGQKLITVTKS